MPLRNKMIKMFNRSVSLILLCLFLSSLCSCVRREGYVPAQASTVINTLKLKCPAGWWGDIQSLIIEDIANKRIIDLLTYKNEDGEQVVEFSVPLPDYRDLKWNAIHYDAYGTTALYVSSDNVKFNLHCNFILKNRRDVGVDFLGGSCIFLDSIVIGDTIIPRYTNTDVTGVFAINISYYYGWTPSSRPGA